MMIKMHCESRYRDLKAWARLNLLRALKFRVSRKSLEQMYISFVRPLLEYCDSVWDYASVDSKKQLDAEHIDAAQKTSPVLPKCVASKNCYLT